MAICGHHKDKEHVWSRARPAGSAAGVLQGKLLASIRPPGPTRPEYDLSYPHPSLDPHGSRCDVPATLSPSRAKVTFRQPALWLAHGYSVTSMFTVSTSDASHLSRKTPTTKTSYCLARETAPAIQFSGRTLWDMANPLSFDGNCINKRRGIKRGVNEKRNITPGP